MTSVAIEGIRLALRELGYAEGQNIAIEYRYAEGKDDRSSELAAELVRLKVETAERLPTFGLVINLKTAKRIGLTIPPNVLASADKVSRRPCRRTGHSRLSYDFEAVSNRPC
jgi:hypothetical protein